MNRGNEQSGLDRLIFGRTPSGKPPVAPQPDLFGGMNRNMKAFAGPTQGSQNYDYAVGKARQNLGGLTSAEGKAQLGKGFGAIAGQQGQAANAARYGIAKAGGGGGVQMDAQRRMGEAAQEKIADVGRDVTIQNYDIKAKRLADFAQMSGNQDAMKMAKIAFAGQLTIAELQAVMDKYSADMLQYAAQLGDESGGIIGGVADYYTGGIGGDLWMDLKRG